MGVNLEGWGSRGAGENLDTVLILTTFLKGFGSHNMTIVLMMGLAMITILRLKRRKRYVLVPLKKTAGKPGSGYVMNIYVQNEKTPPKRG